MKTMTWSGIKLGMQAVKVLVKLPEPVLLQCPKTMLTMQLLNSLGVQLNLCKTATQK